jgi:hypothetical protein
MEAQTDLANFGPSPFWNRAAASKVVPRKDSVKAWFYVDGIEGAVRGSTPYGQEVLKAEGKEALLDEDIVFHTVNMLN